MPITSTLRGGDAKEIRLALVLNGGVSLAVWMGGVTHELDLLCRATGPEPPGEQITCSEKRVLDIWREVAARVRVVIDIVSGTSAGGLNGMLLATAIGRGTKLPYLRRVWEESAALDKLLATPSRQSLLDGGFFTEKITEELKKICGGSNQSAEPVSLFMTATALDGRARSYTDSFGVPFEVRDHRRVYHFEHDEDAEAYRKLGDETWGFVNDWRPDFGSGNNEALAQAARASASFPVAFPPVNEYPMMAFRQHPSSVFDDPASCVIDGGVLNNAPFGPVLESISKRRLDKPVRRVVVYVVPSAGRTAQERVARSSCGDISFVTAALNAVQYPRETDFRTGTQDLSTRLGTSIRDSQQELFTRMYRQRAETALPEKSLQHYVRESASHLFDEYRLNRAAAVLWETRKRLADASTVTSLMAMPEADAEALGRILAKNPSYSPRRGDRRQLYDADLEEWAWGLIPAQRICEILSNHLHACLDFDSIRSDEKKAQSLIEGAAEVRQQLRRVIAVTDAVRRQLRAEHEPGAYLSHADLSDLINTVFAQLSVPARIGEIVKTAGNRYAKALELAGLSDGVPPDKLRQEVIHDCLAVEVVTGAYAPPSKVVEPPTPPFEFLRLGPDTISPLFNETRFADLGERKLYGIRFQHFGAFIDQEWRRSDFTWGRLDAAHHLLSLLLPDPEERRAQEIKLHKAILEAEAPTPEASHAWMEHHLNKLKGTDKQLIETPEGRKSLKGTIESVLALLGNPPTDGATGITLAAGSSWRKVLQYTRPAIARESNRLERGDKRLVRWLTAYLRRRTWRAYDWVWQQDDRDLGEIPQAFHKAVLPQLILIGVTVGLIGAAVGAAITACLLLRYR
ncbi:patatin-like protein [Streptomyces roseoverticillatus]|uniref:Patatin-like protein n=1 Tax=Streptomyces roseoverticillatus TaxID=66429 RepID=A0ABV3J3I6_9ACTN